MKTVLHVILLQPRSIDSVHLFTLVVVIVAGLWVAFVESHAMTQYFSFEL
jgi:hypothetical protein